MIERKSLTISIPIETHRKLKLAATNQDTTMTKILMKFINQAIQEWEEKEGEAEKD